MVDLSDVKPGDDLESVIAMAAGVAIPSTTTRDDRRRALAALLEDGAPVCLDNAEHLLSDLRDLLDDVRLLTSTTFVMTSREPLVADYESVIELAPFSPRESLRYFDTRARRLGPRYELEDDERDDALMLVTRLDGLPLAMELAAHRLTLLRPAALLERLERSGDVLVASGVEVPQRARSLLAAIRSSWTASTDDEQRALARLCALDGPFEPLLGEAAIGLEDGIGIIDGLRRRSFLVDEPDGRLRILIPIRQFLRGEQRAEDRVAAIRGIATELARGAPAFLHAAERLYPLKTVRGFREAHAHLRLVIDAAAENRDLLEQEVLILCAMASAEVTRLDGRHGDRLGALVSIAEHLGDSAVRLHVRLARLERELSRLDESAARLRRCAELAEGSELVEALVEQSATAMFSGDAELAVSAVSRARELATTDLGRAHAALQLGGLLFHQGSYDEARDHLEEAIRFARRADDRRTETRAMHNLGVVHTDQLRIDLARRFLTEAVERHHQHGDLVPEAWAENSLGIIALRVHDEEEGMQRLQRAQQLFERAGMRTGSASALTNLAMVALDFDRPKEARDYALDAVERCNVGEDPYILNGAYLALAVSTWLLGDREQAGRLLAERADGVSQESGHVQMSVSWLAAWAAFLAGRGDPRAESVLVKGEALLADVDGHEVYRTMFALSRAHSRLWDYGCARTEGDAEGALDAAFRLLNCVRGCTPEGAEALRYSLRLLTHEAPDELAELISAEAPADAADRFIVSRALQAFRTPHGAWRALDRSPSIWRLFEALLDARVERPGIALDNEELQRAVWPGEVLTADSAANRLYVSLSKLRKAGLKGLICREEDGYRLDDTVEVIAAN